MISRQGAEDAPCRKPRLRLAPGWNHQTHIDVLPSAGLVTMDGQSVHPGLEGGDGFRQEIASLIKGDEARKLSRQHPVEIDFRVFVVMSLEFQAAQVLISEPELPPQPNVRGIPNGLHQSARRARRAKPRRALLPF